MDPYNSGSKPPPTDIIEFPTPYVLTHDGLKPQQMALNAHDDAEAMEKVHDFLRDRSHRATIARTRLSTGEVYQVKEIFGCTVGEFL